MGALGVLSCYSCTSPTCPTDCKIRQDFMPAEDPPRLARVLRRAWKEGSHGVLDGFRIGWVLPASQLAMAELCRVTQEPHKHPHYVSLLLALSRRPPVVKTDDIAEEPQVGEKRKAPDGADVEPEYGREVLEDLNRAFQGWVEGREWMNVRLCVCCLRICCRSG